MKKWNWFQTKAGEKLAHRHHLEKIPSSDTDVSLKLDKTFKEGSPKGATPSELCKIQKPGTLKVSDDGNEEHSSRRESDGDQSEKERRGAYNRLSQISFPGLDLPVDSPPMNPLE
jgi:hypothetical protein